MLHSMPYIDGLKNPAKLANNAGSCGFGGGKKGLHCHLSTEHLISYDQTGCRLNLARVALICRCHPAQRRTSELRGDGLRGEVPGNLSNSREHERVRVDRSWIGLSESRLKLQPNDKM